MRIFFLGFVTLFLTAEYAFADYSRTLTYCIGERREECESRFGKTAFNAAPGCTEGEIMPFVQKTCSKKGSGKRVDFHTVVQTSQGGELCGYSLVHLYCHWDEPLD